MQIEGIGDIVGYCERLVETKQKEIETALEQVALLKSEVAALHKLAKAAGSIGLTVPVRREKVHRAKGEMKPNSRTAQVLEVLRASQTALDLGTIARRIGLEDNTVNRTKISAALTTMVRGPQSPAIRVGAGTYTARQLGHIDELPEDQVAAFAP